MLHPFLAVAGEAFTDHFHSAAFPDAGILGESGTSAGFIEVGFARIIGDLAMVGGDGEIEVV